MPATWRFDEVVRPAGPGDADGVAAEPLRAGRHGPWEVRDHLVGDDHRDGDRDERLAEVLPLVPAQEELLHGETEDADADHRDEPRDDPLERAHLGATAARTRTRHLLLHLVGDVAAEEVEGAVGHVHDAHEPEDEREPARDDEEQARERQPVEDRVRNAAEVVERRAEVRRAPVSAALERRRLREEQDVERSRTRPARPRRAWALAERHHLDGASPPPARRTYQGAVTLSTRNAR